jgi:3-methylcrotonyl-CoA carboxylase alpha subunit
MKFRLAGRPGEFDVELMRSGGSSVRARINGEEEIIGLAGAWSDQGCIIRIGKRAVRVFIARRRDSIWVAAGPAQFELIPLEGRGARRVHGLATPEITAPMPGKVVKLPVTEGQRVEAGDALVVLEAMKMETALHAESPAIVKQIRVGVGQMVDHGVVLVLLSPVPLQPAGGADSPSH